jgi:hypothetical protein
MLARRARRRAAHGLWFVLAVLLVVLPAHPARAQTGALFLLVPFGARAVGMGEAVSADTALGTEGIWWNPAATARATSKEVALNHSQTVLARSSDMLTVVIPSRVIGTLTVAGYSVDYGDQEATDQNNGQPIGLISTRNYMLALGYSTTVGKRASVGLSYKYVVLRSACAGTCGAFPVLAGKSFALDAGGQYVLPTRFPISVGASVRNIGPKMQIKDQPQADPLPRVIQVGVMSRLPIKSLADGGASLDVSADVMNVPSASVSSSETMLGFGAALGYREMYVLRGGYKKQRGDGGGLSFGFGIQKGAFGLDFSRRLDRLSSQLGETPTYVSLKARF